MLLSSEFQIQFLNKIQLLLESGKFTSTYKFALLIALTNVAVEKGNEFWRRPRCGPERCRP